MIFFSIKPTPVTVIIPKVKKYVFSPIEAKKTKMNTIFQIIKVVQHVFKHLHKEKELIPQGFFQPFWEGALRPFALGDFWYFNQNWKNFYNHFYMIFLNRDPKTALNHSYSWLYAFNILIKSQLKMKAIR